MWTEHVCCSRCCVLLMALHIAKLHDSPFRVVCDRVLFRLPIDDEVPGFRGFLQHFIVAGMMQSSRCRLWTTSVLVKLKRRDRAPSDCKGPGYMRERNPLMQQTRMLIEWLARDRKSASAFGVLSTVDLDEKMVQPRRVKGPECPASL